LGNGLLGSLEPATHTTPDAISLQRLLYSFRLAGCRAVAMEVSSHGLEQGRVTAVKFDIAVFTNLSRDHLDYHGDMTRYGAAKKRLFTLPTLRSAVVNLADPFSKDIAGAIAPNVDLVGYVLGQSGDGIRRSHRCLQGMIVRSDRRTMTLRLTGSWGEYELATSLLGEFTAMNLLAAAAALLQSGLDLNEVVARLSHMPGVPGRMEPYGMAGRPLVFVDYAHTPDAMQHALHAARKYCPGRLWCVFGCGGNRDRGKRPQMGAIAESLADRVVVTDDNPRDERPEDIVSEIKWGLKSPSAVTFIHDRAAAIEYAIAQAGPDDVVLVAGKGHEEYQEISGVRRDFSDRELVRRLVGEREILC
jgi:UDP-N-acetylmuramoyl-L-alanyl-D-glutamate--2,6-diaminopimelate ligase